MRCVVTLLASTTDARAEAEYQIRAVHKRGGYDWTEIEAHLVSGSDVNDPDASVLEVVRFMPLAETIRRAALAAEAR